MTSSAPARSLLEQKLRVTGSHVAFLGRPQRLCLGLAPSRAGLGIGAARSAFRVAASLSSEEPSEARLDREERLWLREEQRWQREEQRWQREEQRWQRERQQLEAQVELLRGALVDALALARVGPTAGTPIGGASEGGAIDIEVRLQALGLLPPAPATPAASLPKPTQAVIPAVPEATVAATPTLEVAETLAAPAQAPEKGASSSSSAASAPSSAQVTASSAPSTASSAAPAGIVKPPIATPAPSIASPVHSPATSAPSNTRAVASSRRTLRTGHEGDDVLEMQNALLLQGFYCGEEDMEYAFFSETTESAVKTWQATLRLKEDGVMTAELLALLFGDQEPETKGTTEEVAVASLLETPRDPSAASKPPPAAPLPLEAGTGLTPEVGPTSRSPEPTRERPEIERYARSKLEMGEHRVFLLGENRWEDPARLRKGADKANSATSSASFGTAVRAVNGVVSASLGQGPAAGAGAGGLKLVVRQCFQCRGEGRVTCLECEGTGDLNVEEQFLDWVGEDAKCLYCNGVGAQTCDACDGSGQQEE